MDSILGSVKSYIGIQEEDSSFDSDLIMDINAIMFVLNHMGVGPTEVFVVDSSDQSWDELVDEHLIGVVRQYVNMRVRLMFDPPANSQIKLAIDEQISELEWRIQAEIDREYYESREV